MNKQPTKNEARASEAASKFIEETGKRCVAVDNIVKEHFPKEENE